MNFLCEKKNTKYLVGQLDFQAACVIKERPKSAQQRIETWEQPENTSEVNLEI